MLKKLEIFNIDIFEYSYDKMVKEVIMKKKLILDLLKRFKSNKSNEYGIKSLGLFGSVARDEITLNSDIDICIKTKKADMFMMVHIKDELEELLSCKIDLIRVRDNMNPFLKNRIEKDVIFV